jgi:hypothetical protein
MILFWKSIFRLLLNPNIDYYIIPSLRGINNELGNSKSCCNIWIQGHCHFEKSSIFCLRKFKKFIEKILMTFQFEICFLQSNQKNCFMEFYIFQIWMLFNNFSMKFWFFLRKMFVRFLFFQKSIKEIKRFFLLIFLNFMNFDSNNCKLYLIK